MIGNQGLTYVGLVYVADEGQAQEATDIAVSAACERVKLVRVELQGNRRKATTKTTGSDLLGMDIRRGHKCVGRRNWGYMQGGKAAVPEADD